MKSNHPRWGLVLVLLGVTLAFATPADAQRRGFIIGFGLGAGHYSISPQGGASQGKTGLGFDFHIGGVVGTGVEIYHFQKGIVSGSDNLNVDTQGTGVSGISCTRQSRSTVTTPACWAFSSRLTS